MHSQWDILFVIKEAYAKCIGTVCRKHGLNLMEFSILLLLSEDSTLDTAQKLVNTYHLSKSHVSTSLNTLESKGLVKRLKIEGKRKNVRLEVMEHGFEIAAEGKISLGKLEQILEQGFSRKEVAILKNSVETVKSNLQHYIQMNLEGQDLL